MEYVKIQFTDAQKQILIKASNHHHESLATLLQNAIERGLRDELTLESITAPPVFNRGINALVTKDNIDHINKLASEKGVARSMFLRQLVITTLTFDMLRDVESTLVESTEAAQPTRLIQYIER